MITCSVCSTENSDLSLVCSSCKGFLQGRADALDLFATIWGLVESPRATFKRIVLAKHKNYSILLSSLFGICLVFNIAWYKSLASVFASLAPIVGAAIVLGPLLGILVVFLISVILQLITKTYGGNGTRGNVFAAIAYATMPMAVSLVFLVPLDVAIFGMDFFGTNPPPMLIKPVEYAVLIGLKSVAALYALYLLTEATMAANAFVRGKFFVVTLSVVGVVVALALTVHFVKV